VNTEKILEKLCHVTENVRRDVMLNEYTTFKVGGPADIMVEPASVRELQAVSKIMNESGIPYTVLGNGSNVLVKDSGYRGVIILIGSKLGGITVNADECTLKAGAGSMLGEVARAAAGASLTGMEFASGIPGTAGGGVFMNAGAYGGEMSHIVKSVKAVMPDGTLREFSAGELNFGYRHSVFYENGGIIAEAEFQLNNGDAAEISETMKDLSRRRIEKQPLNYPSAGSTFKRPEGYFAGKLIQDAGCKGLSLGGAAVSQKHSGFIVNQGKATAQDILDLIKLVQMRVKEEFGVDLETEVRIIG
jgi:UDP-N-acetylmuramate dehydrogenase